jgi:hypothetical protein
MKLNYQTIAIKALEGAVIAGASAIVAQISAGTQLTDYKALLPTFLAAFAGALWKAAKSVVNQDQAIPIAPTAPAAIHGFTPLVKSDPVVAPAVPVGTPPGPQPATYVPPATPTAQ